MPGLAPASAQGKLRIPGLSRDAGLPAKVANIHPRVLGHRFGIETPVLLTYIAGCEVRAGAVELNEVCL